jgi:di/tricarboxylate transporter
MLARLGNALYGAGCIFAVFMIGFGVLLWSTDANARSQGGTIIILCGGLALVGWVIGWACRYVLAERT